MRSVPLSRNNKKEWLRKRRGNIMSNQTPVHISVVLDRSGSMAVIAGDVVGGFNTFLDEQRKQEGGGRVTLVQFDGQDPFEILIDGEDLNKVGDLDPGRYIPRGNTPLYDAVGRMIATVDAEILERADAGKPIEDQVVVIVTDGVENASREFSGKMISDLIEARRNRAWAFVFLGADESTFEEGAAMGVSQANTAQWAATGEGTAAMFAGVSKETSMYRSMGPSERNRKSERFLEDEDE
jgi:Mg-chelatase subunit ChlD